MIGVVYLEYREKDGYVVAVHETEPINLPEGYASAKAEGFSPGDEFEYYITVNEVRDVEEEINGQIVVTKWVSSVSSVRQGPQASYLMQKLTQKDQEIKELQQLVADLSSLLLEKGVI